MKLLLDVHVPQSWIGELAACGWEAVAWVTVGDPCASDLEILTYARANRFVVVS